MNHAVTGELDGLAWLPSTGWISFGSVFPKTDTKIVTDTGVHGVSDPWHVSNLDATILHPGNGPQTTGSRWMLPLRDASCALKRWFRSSLEKPGRHAAPGVLLLTG